MSETLTRVKDVKAPKFTNDVDVDTSMHSAMRPTAAMMRMHGTGVLKRLLRWPNTLRGSTPSLPITYMRREALACVAMPEVN